MAIFYDAVSGSFNAQGVDVVASKPGKNRILLKGPNPGFAVGDEVEYKSSSVNFRAKIVEIGIGAPYAAYPTGWTGLYVSDQA